MFDHIEAGWSASGDTDQLFLASVKNASSYVDKGIHIGSWGQLQGLFSNIFSIYPQYATLNYRRNLSN